MAGLELDLTQRIVNVHWASGEIIQLSIDMLDDYMDAGIARNPDADIFPDESAQSLEYVNGQTFELDDLNKKWRTYFASKDEADLGDFYFNDGFHFREFLIDLASLPSETNPPDETDPPDEIAPPDANPEVRMLSLSSTPPYFDQKGEARLRIYSKGTVWTAVKGVPSKLVADREPIYDKTKVTAYTDGKIWSFDKNGWIDEDDLGEYAPITERPPHDGGGGGEVSVSSLSGVSSSNLVVGEWLGCVREIEGITGVDIHAPASHVDGSGIITTGASALVRVSANYVPETEGGAVADCECAVLEAGTFAVLATGDVFCSVVFSGQVMAGARKKSSGPETLARASIEVTSPPPP